MAQRQQNNKHLICCHAAQIAKFSTTTVFVAVMFTSTICQLKYSLMINLTWLLGKIKNATNSVVIDTPYYSLSEGKNYFQCFLLIKIYE